MLKSIENPVKFQPSLFASVEREIQGICDSASSRRPVTIERSAKLKIAVLRDPSVMIIKSTAIPSLEQAISQIPQVASEDKRK
jgi:hypothetical protein